MLIIIIQFVTYRITNYWTIISYFTRKMGYFVRNTSRIRASVFSLILFKINIYRYPHSLIRANNIRVNYLVSPRRRLPLSSSNSVVLYCPFRNWSTILPFFLPLVASSKFSLLSCSFVSCRCPNPNRSSRCWRNLQQKCCFWNKQRINFANCPLLTILIKSG